MVETGGTEEPNAVQLQPTNNSTSATRAAGESEKKVEAESPYRVATVGDISLLVQMLDLFGPFELEALTSPQGNTVLHVAASLGHLQMVQIICQSCPNLLRMKNSKGDTALHKAARDGHLEVVKTLINCTTEKRCDVETGNTELLRMQNVEGDTALLDATRSKHVEVARALITAADLEMLNLVNNSGQSAFYLAAELGLYELVKRLLDLPIDHTLSESEQGKTALHAAVLQMHWDIAKKIVKDKPELLEARDDRGMSAFHYVVYWNIAGAVTFLLDINKSITYHTDKEGDFPIHMAAKCGSINVIQEMLKCAPVSRELLDHKGRNVLHVAVVNKRAQVVRYVLENLELAMLINERDNDGNTPLHLATIYGHVRITNILARDERVDIGIVNKDGLCASETITSKTSIIEQGLMRKIFASFAPGCSLQKLIIPEDKIPGDDPNAGEQKIVEKNREKLINTIMLVATLVVTMSFAAGLTMPGGGSVNIGAHTKGAMHIFVISNAIAFYSSIVSVIILFWGNNRDRNFMEFAWKWGMRMLSMALAMLGVAFAAAVNLMVSKFKGLAIVIAVLSFIYLLCILALFIPLQFPLFTENRFLQKLLRLHFNFVLYLITSCDYEVAALKFLG